MANCQTLFKGQFLEDKRIVLEEKDAHFSQKQKTSDFRSSAGLQ